MPAGRTEDGLQFALGQIVWRVRWNLRASRIEFLDEAEPDAAWGVGDVLRTSHIRALIAERCSIDRQGKPVPLRFGREQWEDYTHALAFHAQVDPFLEWLEDLPAWDEVPRLDLWLGSLLDDEIDPELLAWASCSVLLAAVWRAYRPGEPHHELVVLVGGQRAAKSSLWASLLPASHRREWFSDGLTFTGDLSQRVETVKNRVLVEACELAGSTKAEVERITAFLTRSDDGAIRLPSGRDPLQLPRRCVIVGSTDDTGGLPDGPSGNRRFVPILVTGGDPEAVQRELDEQEHREQLWAEALVRYRKGEHPRLPRDLWRAQEDLVERHRAIGSLADRPADLDEAHVRGGVNATAARRRLRQAKVGGCGCLRAAARRRSHDDAETRVSGPSRRQSWRSRSCPPPKQRSQRQAAFGVTHRQVTRRL